MQSSRWPHIVRREHGQTLVIGILFMTVLLGMVAMTVDVGLLFRDRRHLQNSADAMALAGVAELPTNPGQAVSRAQQWATNNGIASGEIKKFEVPAFQTTRSTSNSRVISAGSSGACSARREATWVRTPPPASGRSPAATT